MARFAIALSAGASLVACSALLGLTDPTLDNSIGGDGSTIGDGANGDGAASDGGSEASGSCSGADTTSDPKNCGACNHDCLGGKCNASACQPMLMVDDATNLAPRFMVEDSTTLYFTSSRSDMPIANLAKISKNSTDAAASATMLGRFDDGDGGNFKIILPYQLAVSGTTIFVSLNASLYEGNEYQGGIAKCDTNTGCSPFQGSDTLFLQSFDTKAVAYDGNDLIYGFSNLVDGGLASEFFQVRADFIVGSMKSTLDTASADINFIILDSAQNVYAATNDGIVKTNESAVDTGTPLVTGIEADQMAIFNGAIYFTSAPDVGTPTVQTVSTTGGAASQIVASGSFLHAPAGIAVDTNYMYIADQGDLSVRTDGHVYRCPLAGCGEDGGAATMLSTGPSDGNNPRTIVASDKDAIYWGNRYGQIWKLAK